MYIIVHCDNMVEKTEREKSKGKKSYKMGMEMDKSWRIPLHSCSCFRIFVSWKEWRRPIVFVLDLYWSRQTRSRHGNPKGGVWVYHRSHRHHPQLFLRHLRPRYY